MKQNITNLFSTSPDILIVDDDIQHLSEMVKWLEHRQGKIYQARSGQQAQTILAKQRVDAVITDWQMPEMSGIKLIEHLRQSEFKGPLLLCTGMMLSPEHLQIAFEAGANDYLRKPLNHVEFNARLDNALALHAQHKALLLLSNSQQKLLNLLTRELGEKLHHLIQIQRFEKDVQKEHALSLKLSQNFKKLMDWARYRFNLSDSKTEPFELKALLKSVANLFPEQQKRMVLRGGKNIYTDSDPQVLLKVLKELTDNALKYGEGKVSIGIVKSGNHRALFTVKSQSRLSEGALERLSNKENQGLGLLICSDLLSLLNSKLFTRKSRTGEAVFYFELAIK